MSRNGQSKKVLGLDNGTTTGAQRSGQHSRMAEHRMRKVLQLPSSAAPAHMSRFEMPHSWGSQSTCAPPHTHIRPGGPQPLLFSLAVRGREREPVVTEGQRNHCRKQFGRPASCQTHSAKREQGRRATASHSPLLSFPKNF